MANLIIIAGHTGQGKTTFCKKLIDKKQCLVFDINDEYQELSENHLNQRARCISLDVEIFLQKVKQRENSIILFEDATGFFEGKIDRDITKIIVAKRHTNNTLVFLFHSITDIPPKIARLANYLVIFKTLDQPDIIAKKYKTLYPAYIDFINSKQRYKVCKLI